jgi:hypothetical protein
MFKLLVPRRPFVSHASSLVVEVDVAVLLVDVLELEVAVLEDELLDDELLDDELLLDDEELLLEDELLLLALEDELLLPEVEHCLCFAWNAGSDPWPSASHGGFDGGGLGVPLLPCPPSL